MPNTYVEADVKALIAAAVHEQAEAIAVAVYEHAQTPAAEAASAFLVVCQTAAIDAEKLEVQLRKRRRSNR